MLRTSGDHERSDVWWCVREFSCRRLRPCEVGNAVRLPQGLLFSRPSDIPGVMFDHSQHGVPGIVVESGRTAVCLPCQWPNLFDKTKEGDFVSQSTQTNLPS